MIWNGSPLGFDQGGRPIPFDGNEPTLIVGAVGSTKTVGVVVNQLLDEPGRRSFIVIDPKGEVAAITARYRRAVCGPENVKIINPFRVLADLRPDLESDGWNPLADLDPKSPTLGDECAAFGDALIKADTNQAQKHFPDAARSACTGRIKFEVIETDKKCKPPSLASVREALTQDAKALKAEVQKMIAGGDFDVKTRLQKFLADTDELENIKSTIESNTGWMTQQVVDDMAGWGRVSFRACSKVPTTIYIILPPQELQHKAVYLRLALTAGLRGAYRQGGVPITLLVEEGFVIGHHAEVEQALSILRGFGSRMTVVFQSIAQIKRLYPDTWGLFTAGAVIAFRPSDPETAEWMSKRAGEVLRPSLSASDPSQPQETGARPNWSPQKRERIPVGKMFAMPRGRALVWLPGDDAPRHTRVRGYFEIPAMKARADPNPYYTPAPVSNRAAVLSGLLFGSVAGLVSGFLSFFKWKPARAVLAVMLGLAVVIVWNTLRASKTSPHVPATLTQKEQSDLDRQLLLGLFPHSADRSPVPAVPPAAPLPAQNHKRKKPQALAPSGLY